MKIVINNCYGGFGLSYNGIKKYAELSGIELYPFVEEKVGSTILTDRFRPYEEGENAFIIHWSTKPLRENGSYEDDSYWSEYSIDRTDPALVKTIEELGENANGRCASLGIVEIPDDVQWEIGEYDGVETVHEKHRSWS